MNVVNVDRLIGGSHADLVGGAVILSRFGVAGHPHSEAPGIVVAAVADVVVRPKVKMDSMG